MKKGTKLLFVVVVFFSCKSTISQNLATQNQAIVQQLFEHFNNHEWAKMANLYSELAQFKDPTLGKGIIEQTRFQISQKYTELNKSIPDINDKVINTLVSGENYVIVEFISSGTSQDGSRFELPICTVFKIENEKIVQDFTYFDNF
jgi:ketosteroid isomerase-like protein